MIFENLPFPEDQTPAENLGWLMMGYRMTQLVYVAAELGVADYLVDNPKSAKEIARQVGADPDHLHRVLRALTSIGVFEDCGGGKFGQNSRSKLLRKDIDGSMRDTAIRHGAEWSWLPWGALLHAVKTGETAFNHAFGISHWDYTASHPKAAAGFSRSMGESTAWISSAVIKDYDFPESGTIVDVGGGDGALLADILDAYPNASGILFDRAEVMDTARKKLADRGLLSRCQLVAGDFFSGVPAGGDVYILKRIIHDWGDGNCIRILNQCRVAMGDYGKLLIIDRVMPESAKPSPVKIVDVTVMVLFGKAKERTEKEFKQIMEKSGLKMTEQNPIHIPASIIEVAGYSIIKGLVK